MVMLQNLCAKVKPSSAFFTLILLKEELIYMMFPACREKQMVMLEMDGQMWNQFYIHYNDFVEVKSMNANLETCI